jgi:hypothetical protein
VVHPHLKLVLLVQAAVVVWWACTRTICLAVKLFIFHDPFWQSPPVLSAVDTVALKFMLQIGHVLLLERLLATWMVTRYEHFRSAWFSAGWLLVLVSCLYAKNNLGFWCS